MTVRVLVVEDEALLAIDIAEHLIDAGFGVVGPVSSVGKAMKLIQEHGCDIAVLDVNLRDETSEPVAHELRARGTPFIFLSGVSKEDLPDWFDGAVARLVGIECGVVSGVFNLESSGVEASDWRPRHDEQYHEA